MKKIYLLLSLLIICVSSLFAQAPEKFTYQAVVRNASNQLVINAQVGVRVNILQGSASGNAVYSESHVTSSNANGLVTVNIGGGSVLHGSFEGIDWSDGPYFLKTDIDPNGGNDYSITSTQQLLSVPYALYAKEAGNGFSGDYNDLTNTPTIPTVPTNVSAFTNDAGYITAGQVPAQVNADWNATSGAAEILNKPTIPTVPTNVSAFNNDAGYITNNDIPAVPTVPTNVSAFTNDAGYLTSYTETDPQFSAWDKDYNDLTNKPVIPTVPTNVSAFTNDAGYLTSFTEQQVLSISHDTLFLTGGSFVKLPASFDGNYNSLTNKPTIPTVPTNVSAFTNDAGYITSGDIPAIPTVPTNVSAFNNDAGYITGYTETDPQFNAWDKDYNDLTNKPIIPTVPTNVSAFNNDAGYITMDSVPAIPTNVSAFTNDAGYITAANVQEAANIPTNVSAFVNDAGYLTSFTEQQVLSLSNDTIFLTGESYIKLPAGFDGDYNSLINQPEIPTVPTDVSAFNNDAGYITSADIPSVPTNVSQLNNDAGYITAAQCGDVDICALVNLVQQLQSQVESLQSSLDSIKNQGGEVQTALPTVTTNTVTSITSTSVTCGGNVTSDGGASVTARGVCWSTSQNPTVSNSHTTDGSGTGSFSSSISGITANTTYYVRAYATNSAGTAYGETVTFTTLSAGGTAVIDSKSCPTAPMVTDHEGNVYATVQIGNQCWMRDNLRTTTSPSTGTYLIPAANANYTYTGKQAFWYNNDSATYAPQNYGLLYNWNAAVDTFNTTYGETSVNTSSSNAVSVTFNGHRRGICPVGWHLPSDAEWTQLTNYVSSQSEYTCDSNSNYIAKALASTEGWNTSTNNCEVGNDPSTNNATGFSAVPAGGCNGSFFANAGYGAYFWSSTQYNSYFAYGRYLDYYDASVVRDYDGKSGGYSVRCLRDETGGGESTVTLPAVSTNAVSGITATSANCGGNITSDGGASVTARGVCWSTSQNPTVNGSHTADGSGMGSFSSSISGLTANTTYYVRAYATNSVGTAYGNEVSFTTLSAAVIDSKSCPAAPTVTDHEGNVYATVQIGDQCWMRDNLRTTTSPSTGTYLIPAANANYTYTGKQARWYNNDSATYAPMNYGLLYNWNAAVDTFNIAFGETSVDSSESNAVSMNFTGFRRGICPVGWHLPSDEEWTQLTDYVSSQSEYTCGSMNTYIAKALASTTSWNTNTDHTCVVGYDQSTNNATGFSAIPAGDAAGSLFIPTGVAAEFGSCTQYSGSEAWYRVLIYYHMGVVRINGVKYGGFSIRCLRDAESGGGSTVQLPSVTTTTLSNIASSTATCGGNVTSDGGATVTACGVCWSTSQNPTVNGNHTISGTGMGSFTSNLTGLAAGTTYYVRAYATNSVGTAYGNEVSFTALSAAVVDEKSCPAALTVTDHEGNVYATVQIGSQCWMRDNLRTSTSPSTGTYLIPVPGTYFTYTGKQARWYDNDPATYALQNYGLLYNWNAAVDTFNTAYGETSVNSDYGNSVFVSFTGQRRGICPAGWHLPSDAEVTQLTDYVKSQSQYVCGSDNTHIAKALASTTGWNTSTRTCAIGNDQSANNAAGFSAVPAGVFTTLFEAAGFGVEFWSTLQNSIYHTSYGFNYNNANVFRVNQNNVDIVDYRASGLSVRCLRD